MVSGKKAAAQICHPDLVRQPLQAVTPVQIGQQ